MQHSGLNHSANSSGSDHEAAVQRAMSQLGMIHRAVPVFQGLRRDMLEASQRHGEPHGFKVQFSIVEEQSAGEGSQSPAKRRHIHLNYGSDASYTDRGSDDTFSDGSDTDDEHASPLPSSGFSTSSLAPPGAVRGFPGMFRKQDTGESEAEDLGKTAL
jgi:hypothetical protein